MIRSPLIFVAAFAIQTSQAVANDTGLYEDVFAPNSSFVRVVAPGQSFVAIDGTTLRDIETGVSGFVNVMPGDIPISASSGSTSLSAGAGAHYTLIMLDNETVEIIEDEIVNDPAKADVTLYNLSDMSDVELFVPLADTVAIGGVGSMSGETVSLRAPLTLDFEIRSGGETLTVVSGIDLQRGAGVSIVLTETIAGFSAEATSNTYLK